MKGRILICDDDPIIRLDIKQILEQSDYEVAAEASDGFEAIELCQKHFFDLVIMDIKLPLLDGLSAGKKILDDELNRSNQLLFLRTINSELRIRGNHGIRQWCSWEIGNFYTKHSGEKYYTSFYDTAEPSNDILDTFKPMKEVVNGDICY